MGKKKQKQNRQKARKNRMNLLIQNGTVVDPKSQKVFHSDVLTEDDRIAFPYGKTAVEGAAVTEDESIEY